MLNYNTSVLSKENYNLEYAWHPLYKYVYTLTNLYKDNVREIKNYTTFNDIFNSVKDKLSDSKDEKLKEVICELKDVFNPLDITCLDNFVLFKYKNFIELSDLGYDNYIFWTMHEGLYRECRSIVFDISDCSIVLAPQSKFHNVNEIDGWMEEDIRRRINSSNVNNIEITNKLDGSNQNYSWSSKYNRVIGSGSSALDVKESWRLKKGFKLLTENYVQMLKAYPDFTFMFEYISPDNPIVVCYTREQEGLYLFGIRNNKTGLEMNYKEVLEIGHKFNVKTTEIYNDSFDDILGKLDDYTCDEKEGWVIAIQDNQGKIFKAKLKVNDYVLMHKALSKNISPNAIIKAICDNKWDDFYSKIPIAYKEYADKISMQVFQYISYMGNNIFKNYADILHDMGDNNISIKDKKEFMIRCNEVPKIFRGYVRSMYLNQEYNVLKKSENGYKKLSELQI